MGEARVDATLYDAGIERSNRALCVQKETGMKRMVLFLSMFLASASAWAGNVVFTEVELLGKRRRPTPARHQYRNPVLAGFYPDPSAVRVGDDFYLVTSTFGYYPGLPVFHSRDLVSWQQIGNAIDRPTQLDYGDNEELTRGLFAPSISYHDGVFYIVNTCFYCDRGNYLVTTRNPAGAWSDPVWLGFSGIDPSLFFDDDGRAWMLNNDIPDGKLRYEGHRAIWLQQYDVASRKMIGPRTVLVDGGADPASKPEYVEGPHLFKREGWYYLTAAEGGTGDMHAEMVWRSKAVGGPYAPFPGNPSLTQRDLDPNRPDPVTSTGHAQYIRLKDGTWWAVFLATRPYRGDQYKYNLGRETFLLPVTWNDGSAGRAAATRTGADAGRPTRPAARRTADRHQRPDAMEGDFRRRDPADAVDDKSSTEGRMVQDECAATQVTPSSSPLGTQGIGGSRQPSYIAHRLQHHDATMAVTPGSFDPTPGELAGLALIQNENYHYIVGVERDERGPALSVYLRSGKASPATGTRIARVDLPTTDKPSPCRSCWRRPASALTTKSMAAAGPCWPAISTRACSACKRREVSSAIRLVRMRIATLQPME